VDLSAHRSRRVEAADLAWADMILLMDHANSEALRILDRRSLRKALWLGALHPTGDVEIADPYGRARDGIEPVLDSIDVCVAVLARRLAPSPETRNGPSRI
jgi:protein-tyrosine-phosphatase